MRRIPLLAAVLSLTLASAASAQGAATTSGAARIEERGGIEATGQLIFQDLMIAPNMPLITTTSTTEASVSMSGGGAMVSLAIPETFDLILTDGKWMLTALTAVDGAPAGKRRSRNLGSPGGSLSVDVGGEISARSEDLAPGEYRGLLVVVAQYN